jgi:nucleotide-binding universal stress UspA family protein
MYKKILVPLDGSKLAECALPHAEEIAFYAKHPGCDIIVMASHGRSGPSRWAYGSVADRVLRASCVPVLMVRAPGCVPGI